MCTIRSFAACVLAIILLDAVTPERANADPIVLNFDSLPAMPYWPLVTVPQSARLSDQLLSTLGVRFSSGSPYVAVINLGPSHATSGFQGITGVRPNGVLTYDRQFPVVASFFDPANPTEPATTDFVSVRVDLWGSGLPVTLNAFDVAGALIDSVTAFEIGGETLAVSGAGIHSVQFLGTFDDNGAALDDFAFNPVTPVSVGGVVPEPDAAVLWAVGLVLLAGRRWLRRQRSTGGPASSSWKIGRCYRRKLYMK